MTLVAVLEQPELLEGGVMALIPESASFLPPVAVDPAVTERHVLSVSPLPRTTLVGKVLRAGT